MTRFYVKIYDDRVVVKNLSTGETAEERPETPYLHPRLQIGNISSAELTLKKAIERVKPKFSLSGIQIVIQPIGDFKDGITEAETRMYRQMAYDARAGEIAFWYGRELSDSEIPEILIMARQK